MYNRPNFKVLISLLFLSILVACKNEKPNSVDHQGNTIKEGILSFKSMGKISEIGTIYSSKKNGIWSYYNSNGDLESQIFFENNLAKYKLKTIVPFDIINDSLLGYEIMVPKYWLTKSTDDNISLLGYSKDHPSKIKPTFNIIFSLDSLNDLNKILDKNVAEMKSSYKIQNVRLIGQSVSIMEINIQGSNIINSNKFILSKNGYYTLTCTCERDDYEQYSKIFTTIINSFQSLK